jgi:hypothetical protein
MKNPVTKIVAAAAIAGALGLGGVGLAAAQDDTPTTDDSTITPTDDSTVTPADDAATTDDSTTDDSTTDDSATVPGEGEGVRPEHGPRGAGGDGCPDMGGSDDGADSEASSLAAA